MREATSALSPADEARIVAMLRGLLHGMTVVTIAHRASSVAWTDRLIVVDGGRVVDAGRVLTGSARGA